MTPETVSPSFSLSLSVSLLYLLSFCKPHTRDGVMIEDPLGFKGDAGSGTPRVASDASSLMFSILQVRGTENAVFLSPWGPSKKRPPITRWRVHSIHILLTKLSSPFAFQTLSLITLSVSPPFLLACIVFKQKLDVILICCSTAKAFLYRLASLKIG